VSDQHLKIDKAGVLDVSAQLRTNVDKDVSPHSDHIRQTFMHYSVFGQRSGSPVVQAAVNQYFAQLRAAVDFLDALTTEIDVMAQIAQDVVAAYAHADTLSADQIDALFSGASANVQTQLDRDAQVERDQQDVREVKRGME